MTEQLFHALLSDAVPLKVGMMVATAMLIGFFLYDVYTKTVVRLFVSFLAMMVYLGWIQQAVISEMTGSNHPTGLATALTIGLGLLFLAGLTTGMMLGRGHVKKKQAIDNAARAVMKKIDAGTLGQKTQPRPQTKKDKKE